MARFSRTRSKQRHSRCANRLRLVHVSAYRTVAPGDRTGLVVLRRSWRLSLHAGAARRRRDRRLLQGLHRPAGMETSRSGPVLGVECRRRSTRDASAQRRSCLHSGRDWNLERARRRQRCRRVVAQRSGRHGHEDSGLGLFRFAAGRGRSGHRCSQRQARRVRRRDGQASLVRSESRRELQLAAAHDACRRPAGRAAQPRWRHQRRAGRRHRVMAARVVLRRYRAAGAQRRR